MLESDADVGKCQGASMRGIYSQLWIPQNHQGGRLRCEESECLSRITDSLMFGSDAYLEARDKMVLPEHSLLLGNITRWHGRPGDAIHEARDHVVVRENLCSTAIANKAPSNT